MTEQEIRSTFKLSDDQELIKKLLAIKTPLDFDEFVKILEEKELSHNDDYEFYNAALYCLGEK